MNTSQRARILRTISERQNHRCCYCGVRTNEATHVEDLATIDHLRGRTDSAENFVMACWRCNNTRQDMPLGCWIILALTDPRVDLKHRIRKTRSNPYNWRVAHNERRAENKQRKIENQLREAERKRNGQAEGYFQSWSDRLILHVPVIPEGNFFDVWEEQYKL